MGLNINRPASIIEVTSPTTTVTVQELADFIEDWMSSPEGLTTEDIWVPEGKLEDPTKPGVFTQIIMVLKSPWQIQFWPGSGYTTISGGKVVGGLINQPFKATGTSGDITVLESQLDGVVVVSGSGVTVGDKTDIVDGVWSHVIEAGFTAEEVMRIKAAVLAGKVSGAGTGTETFKGIDGATDRVISTVDVDGNRTGVTVNGA